MDGITDAPMRALQGESGAFTYAVSEFARVSIEPLPKKVFLRDIPELNNCGMSVTGLPVQVQLLGGDPGRMAESAVTACTAGALGIDINFGCPAPTVNRNDGGASLLRHPCRIREIVAAVRASVPVEIPVSAKLRLGWDDQESIHENAAMAAEGGANWLTIHARTKVQGYAPPVFWPQIGKVRQDLGIPIVANGDIWNLDDFFRCREETGCIHFMIGRAALASPNLPTQIAMELGLVERGDLPEVDWILLLRQLAVHTDQLDRRGPKRTLVRLKQWLSLAKNHGGFEHFDSVKRAENLQEFFEILTAQLGLVESSSNAIHGHGKVS
ncbi:MAG: tRNA-dihydrouridine synthase family protein [Armatimonadetes bacterium]|nr:tRNA-dihydrouridine synthase family protein [Armatimonadota bacterium]